MRRLHSSVVTAACAAATAVLVGGSARGQWIDYFSAGSLDGSRWTPSGTVSVQGGDAVIAPGSNIASTQTFFQQDFTFRLNQFFDSRNQGNYQTYNIGYQGLIGSGAEYLLFRTDNAGGGRILVQSFKSVQGAPVDLTALPVGDGQVHDVVVAVKWTAPDSLRIRLDDLNGPGLDVDTLITNPDWIPTTAMPLMFVDYSGNPGDRNLRVDYAGIDPKWNVDADGNWSVGSNWLGGTPNTNGAIANFTGAATAARTVTVDAPQTVGVITFENGNSYTIAGSSALTMNADTGYGLIRDYLGNHTISAPMVLARDTVVESVYAGNTVTIAGDVSAAGGVTLTKAGAGDVEIKHLRVDNVVMNYIGTLRVLPGTSANEAARASKIKSLFINGGPSSPYATLDLTNNSLAIDYLISSPLADVQQYLVSGYNAGAWNGTGIASSVAAANAGTGIGYAEASAVFGAGGGTFAGQSVDGTAVLLKYTYLGDTNLDGQVDVIDLGNLATGWQTSGTWINGDGNYDGFIDVVDLGLLATNWQAGVGSPLGPGSLSEALAAYGLPSVSVPEPGAMALAAVAGLVLRSRRRH